ncbi:hypothetical protein [Streptomyces sp. IMTB 2501]|nr:hypothetical protein [Streptomyces sp. IMTB 2501]
MAEGLELADQVSGEAGRGGPDYREEMNERHAVWKQITGVTLTTATA